MFKIAILGCENSHANAFIKLTRNVYKDVEVVGVYSDDAEAAKKIQEEFGVYVAKSYDEFVGKVDGIMVTARNGVNHYKYAKPYIESKIPMFIDKPITNDDAEAVKFMKELRANGVKVTGGSSCIHAEYVKELKAAVADGRYGVTYGGFLRAPVNMVNNYGNFLFYAQHLVQVMQEIFGYYPKSVSSKTCGKVTTVTVRYDAYDVCIQYVDGNYTYYASVSTEKNGVVGSVYKISSEMYAPEFETFYKLLCGGEMEVSYKDFIAPVFVITAIERAIKSGKDETVFVCEDI